MCRAEQKSPLTFAPLRLSVLLPSTGELTSHLPPVEVDIARDGRALKVQVRRESTTTAVQLPANGGPIQVHCAHCVEAAAQEDPLTHGEILGTQAVLPLPVELSTNAGQLSPPTLAPLNSTLPAASKPPLSETLAPTHMVSALRQSASAPRNIPPSQFSCPLIVAAARSALPIASKPSVRKTLCFTVSW